MEDKCNSGQSRYLDPYGKEITKEQLDALIQRNEIGDKIETGDKGDKSRKSK